MMTPHATAMLPISKVGDCFLIGSFLAPSMCRQDRGAMR